MRARLATVVHRQWLGYLAALAMVGLVTVLIGVVESFSHLANISMLYLVAVLVSAIAMGRGPAVLAAVSSFLAFDWFLVQPLYTLTVDNPDEWVALLLFLLTALGTGQMAALQRLRTREAREREREAVLLYDAARLLSQPDLEPSLQALAERLRQELDARSVGIRVEGSSLALEAVAGTADDLAAAVGRLPTRLLSEGPAPTKARPGETGRWIRILPEHRRRRGLTGADRQLQVIPVKAKGQRVGEILVLRPGGAPWPPTGEDRLLSALAAQVGLAIERWNLQREATETEILRRADELKSALLNTVSHNLRTPLATVLTLAGDLRQSNKPLAQEDARELGAAIEEEVRRLNRVVGNLLDLSRIESGNLKPQKAWHDLRALVDDVLFRLRALTADHPIVTAIDSDLPPVELDYVEIDQVLSNLIENAAKYTPPDTPIEVSARRQGAEVLIEVADRGPGIAASDLPSLFQPFYRADGPGPRPKGIGLGLAVAKGLVQAHGGRIWATNRNGGGASFTFTLPVGDQPA